MNYRLHILSLAILMAYVSHAAEKVWITKMTTNDEVNPACVNSVRLGWQTNCPEEGTRQTAYEVEVFLGKQTVFKTGRVVSDRQMDVKLPVDWAQGKLYTWRVRIWDQHGKPSAWSARATFGTDINQSWQAQWICTGQTERTDPLPYIRKTFSLKGKKISRAMAYLCGLGCSELWINGQPADSTRVLDPAQTDYGKRALYSALDVTALLQPKGINCLGVMLGKGWYTQDCVWSSKGLSYGMPILRCQLNMEYADGSTETISTDETWLWTEGPITRSSVYQGEDYDARRAIAGWATPSLDDSGWKRCQLASGVIPPRMEVQEMAPMRQQEVVKPIAMWKAPGEGNRWIYDFGANRTANVMFTVDLPEGTKLTTRACETLTDKRDMDYRSTGIKHVGYQEENYICAGTGKECWTPKFTYHGFQYVELTVEGTDQQPDESWLSVIPVHSDLEDRGHFECSEPQLNALHHLARHTFLNGFVGVPVDCNQREKCGWLGDTHAYDLSANMNFQMNNFWMKYLDDIRTTSDCYVRGTLHHKLFNAEFYFTDKTYGIPFMIAPGKRLCGVASPDWGTAVVQLPWHLYLQFGNCDILDAYYDMMSLWTRHIDSTAVEDIVYEGLGDWCPPMADHYHNPTPVEFSSTCFHFIDLTIMAKVARLLGKTDDIAFFDSRRKATCEALMRRFYNPLRHGFGSQTADVMAVMSGLVSDKEAKRVAADLLFDINHTPFRFLDMGIFGLSRFGSTLSRNGYAKEAYELFTKKGDNSWGLMIDSLHVTTLWESIPYTVAAARDISGSHCHPMMGGYDIWFYEDVLGIRPTEEKPGFKQILLDPTMTDCMDWASGSVETAYGCVSSEWKHEGDLLRWRITIPASTNALVALPLGKTVTVNGKPMEQSPKSTRGDKAFYEFASGQYEIEL